MSEPTAIAVELTFPELPEGWKGTPSAFLQWISDNAIFTAGGDFLTGHIGGARPISNVGIFVNGLEVELWQGGTTGSYVPQRTMPVGTVLEWPAPALTPPDNFLFCEGQLLLIDGADSRGGTYEQLANVLGRTYCHPEDDLTHFRVPDYRGRVGVGAASTPGQINPLDPTGTPGNLTLRPAGTYFGAEWPIYNVPTPSNPPATRYSAALQGVATFKAPATTYPWQWTKGTFNGIQPPSIGVRKIIRYR